MTCVIESKSFRINYKKCRIGSFIVGKSICCMDVMELPEEVLIAARLQRTYEEMKTVLETWKHNPVDSQILRIHPDKASEYRRNHLEVFGQTLRPLLKTSSGKSYREMYDLLSANDGIINILDIITIVNIILNT